jgi:hypothetical protein
MALEPIALRRTLAISGFAASKKQIKEEAKLTKVNTMDAPIVTEISDNFHPKIRLCLNRVAGESLSETSRTRT